MDRICYRCGAPIEERTTFCASCGAPQIKVTAPDDVSGGPPAAAPPQITSEPSRPPVISTPLTPAGQIQWRRFWRVALPLILVSVVAMAFFGLLGVLLFCVSLIIAIRRYRRDHNGPLTASQGAKLGAASGLVCYFVFMSFAAARAALDFAQFRQEWMQNLQQRMGTNPDPQMQSVVHWASTNQGMLVLIAISLVISAVFSVVLSGLIGAVAASGSKRS